MAPSKLPKPTEETKSYFGSIVPDHPAITIRPMFGQLSAFVNGNMFMGIFGEDVLVRLPEADREEVLGAGGRGCSSRCRAVRCASTSCSPKPGARSRIGSGSGSLVRWTTPTSSLRNSRKRKK